MHSWLLGACQYFRVLVRKLDKAVVHRTDGSVSYLGTGRRYGG